MGSQTGSPCLWLEHSGESVMPGPKQGTEGKAENVTRRDQRPLEGQFILASSEDYNWGWLSLRQILQILHFSVFIRYMAF